MSDTRAATFGDLKMLADTLSKEVGARLARIERRLDELESRQVRYCGVFESGRRYRKGELVTDAGSVWHCEADTSTRPGDSDAWVLAVKRGNDGRDAR
jgi:hypothetical protein